MVNYDQESSLGQMDTTPIPQVDIIPTFLPPDLVNSASLLPQDSELAFLSEQPSAELPAPFSSAMHLSMSDITMPDFMNVQMDAMDPPMMHPEYLSDMIPVTAPFPMVPASDKLDLSPDARNLSVSPPQSQIPSPSTLGTSSVYTPSALPSLDSALDTGSTPGSRSRANTSLSPPSFPALSPSNPLNGPEFAINNSTSSLGESVSQQQPQTLIGKMLKE